MTRAGQSTRWPALVLVVLLLAVPLAACSATPNTSPPTTAEIGALLTRHAAAVRDHDRAAFVADLDPAAAASAFRSRQEAAYANLVQLPLTSWSYTVAGPADDAGADQAAAKQYGAGALVLHLTLQYALQGVDRTPVSEDLWWTFVRRGGHVVVAADDALADAGGVSWKGPWDYGPLLVIRGRVSLVLGHPAAGEAILQAISTTVDAAVPVVTGVWGPMWSQRVAVIVPGSADEFAEESGEAAALAAEIASTSIFDGPDPVTGAITGERLIINPAALTRLSAVGRQITIRHEITHLASAAGTTDASPRWLVEGFADYVGNLNSGQTVGTTASELRTDILAGRVPSSLPDDASFETGGAVPQAYEESWLACRLIAAQAGQAGLVRFYRLVGASPDDPDTAVAQALRQVLHESTAQFTARWRAYLETELG